MDWNKLAEMDETQDGPTRSPSKFENARAAYGDGYKFAALLRRTAKAWPVLVLVWYVVTLLFVRHPDSIDLTLMALKAAVLGVILLKASATMIEAQLDSAAANRALLAHFEGRPNAGAESRSLEL